MGPPALPRVRPAPPLRRAARVRGVRAAARRCAARRAQYAPRQPPRRRRRAHAGSTAGFVGVAATIAVGVFGTLTGRQKLYSQMLRARIILVGSTLGLYVAGTGFIPVPPPVTAVFGPPRRAPLQ